MICVLTLAYWGKISSSTLSLCPLWREANPRTPCLLWHAQWQSLNSLCRVDLGEIYFNLIWEGPFSSAWRSNALNWLNLAPHVSLGPSCPKSLASLPLPLIPHSPPRPHVPWESSISLGFDCGKACRGMVGDTWNSCLTCHKHAGNQHKHQHEHILCRNNVRNIGNLGKEQVDCVEYWFSMYFRDGRMIPYHINALYFDILETVWSLRSTVRARE